MLRRVQQYIRQHHLLQQGERVLVCVSGGADSMALWDVLRRGGYDCIVAHCNFHLRAEESDRDEAFVREQIAPFSPLIVQHFATTAYARQRGIGIEMAARELRYQWFAQLACQERCQAIAVAHHQHDQAETLLLNLKRGTGIRGLCGMRPKSDNPMGGECPIIRPLLCTTRDYIEHYLRDIRHLSWVDDSTNANTDITRNAIRKQLAHYSKAEIEHMAATAEYMQGYVDWLENRDTMAAGRVKLYEEIKDEEQDWFIDFFENYNDIMTAEYIDVSLFKNEVDGSPKVEEEPTPRIYRFNITNVEYGFIDIEATSMEEAVEKVYAFDGDYFVHKNDVTKIEFEQYI